MIYTCTLNPSLDYFMEFDEPVQNGKYNRSTLEFYEAGGKGINISSVLSNLDIPSRALGFLGGFTKDLYIELLEQYKYLQPNFTYIDGNTRINVKMHDDNDTTLNATGPFITADNMKSMRDRVRNKIAEGDYLVLAGTSQEYLIDEVSEMLKEAIGEGVRVVLDTHPTIIHNVIGSHPFLVKMTEWDLARYLGRDLHSDEEIIAGMKEVLKEGAKNVLFVSSDASRAILVYEGGVLAGNIMREGKPVNTVGAGDSVIAGFLMNFVRSSDYADSFRLGISCGTATVYSKGLGTKEKIDVFYDSAEVQAVE